MYILIGYRTYSLLDANFPFSKKPRQVNRLVDFCRSNFLLLIGIEIEKFMYRGSTKDYIEKIDFQELFIAVVN